MMAQPNKKSAWIGIQVCMARYCEPYFHAVNSWINFKNEDLILNRLRIIVTFVDIYKEFTNMDTIHKFNLIFENNADLLPEYLPEAGLEFVEGNDLLAFASAKQLIPLSLFQNGGFFFQKGLLRMLAGSSVHRISLEIVIIDHSTTLRRL
jgi:hypothetical protein